MSGIEIVIYYRFFGLSTKLFIRGYVGNRFCFLTCTNCRPSLDTLSSENLFLANHEQFSIIGSKQFIDQLYPCLHQYILLVRQLLQTETSDLCFWKSAMETILFNRQSWVKFQIGLKKSNSVFINMLEQSQY